MAKGAPAGADVEGCLAMLNFAGTAFEMLNASLKFVAIEKYPAVACKA